MRTIYKVIWSGKEDKSNFLYFNNSHLANAKFYSLAAKGYTVILQPMTVSY